METTFYKCNHCKWEGSSDDVIWDTVETCMGTDKIEVCPCCGSMEVFSLHEVNIGIPPNVTVSSDE